MFWYKIPIDFLLKIEQFNCSVGIIILYFTTKILKPRKEEKFCCIHIEYNIGFVLCQPKCFQMPSAMQIKKDKLLSFKLFMPDLNGVYNNVTKAALQR